MINLYYKKPNTEMKNSPYFDPYLFKIEAMTFYKNTLLQLRFNQSLFQVNKHLQAFLKLTLMKGDEGLQVGKEINNFLLNKLTPENINKIIEIYSNREAVEKYAHVASLDEINENDYNLNIPRYVDTFEEEVISLSQVAKELIEVKADITSSYDKLFELLNELNGTTDEAKEELSKFISLLGK